MVGDLSTVNVTLSESITQMEEVVVTALGIKGRQGFKLFCR